MPTGQENALVAKYCAVCHTDALKKGGLSLEHFDAATVPPSLAAMMLSKLTGGASLETARLAPSNADAAALIDRKMKTGAMGAAGIPIPDKATIDGLIRVLSAQARGATEWGLERSKDLLTASILREAGTNPGEAEFYRLIATCNVATREGQIRLSWAPAARAGSLAVSLDGNAAVPYPVASGEIMGNATAVLAGTPLAAESFKGGDLFPGQAVTFSFEGVPKEIGVCFARR